MSCPDCDQALRQNGLDDHRRTECIVGIRVCAKCEIPYVDAAFHQANVCPAHEIECTAGCGLRVKRDHLRTHLSKNCPNASFGPCTFAIFGCPAKHLTLSEHKQHALDFVWEHERLIRIYARSQQCVSSPPPAELSPLTQLDARCEWTEMLPRGGPARTLSTWVTATVSRVEVVPDKLIRVAVRYSHNAQIRWFRSHLVTKLDTLPIQEWLRTFAPESESKTAGGKAEEPWLAPLHSVTKKPQPSGQDVTMILRTLSGQKVKLKLPSAKVEERSVKSKLG
jgi:hypothetical protein